MGREAGRVADRVERGLALLEWLARGVIRHWLALFNLGVALFIALPVAAPVLMAVGATTPARLIYLAYMPACHQLPERSYFLFGEKLVYTLEELEAQGLPPGLSLLRRRTFRGNPSVGYKVAFCQRDVAIYGSILLAGLAYGLLRRYRPIPRLPVKFYLLFLIPMGVDGVTQLIGLRQSNWWLRTITGTLFGVGSVWLAYPLVDEAMRSAAEAEASRRTISPTSLEETPS